MILLGDFDVSKPVIYLVVESIVNSFTQQEDRALGALVGLAVGDALGAPVEFHRRDTFEPVSELRSGGNFNLPAGAWTDDTAMALCLGDSLIEHPEIDAKDLLERFCRWASDGENTSTGVCVGIGQNTLRVLGNFHRTGELLAPETRQKSDGNGAAMRLAPVAIRHWNNPVEVRRTADFQSRTTHYSEISAGACEYLAAMLAALIEGSPWARSLRVTKNSSWPEDVQLIVNEDWSARSRDSIRSSGFVVHTLEAALWAVDTTSSFEDALIKAVNLGDDADSVGAVTGQLAGARYGRGAIPERWTEHIHSLGRIEALARALFQASIEDMGCSRDL
jgi:ADP-ribosyl-[dinitrogen reductase] hydrolase